MTDYPGAINYQASIANYGGYGQPNTPKAIVLHTPEEPADGNESTPVWFANPAAGASTHYYADNDGDIYQMVVDIDCAWANGNRAGVNRTWKGVKDAWPPWAEAGVSLNCQTLSIEIEGYAATIGQTLTDVQFGSLAKWIKFKAAQYGIPLDRDHIIGHFEVATDRTDPGASFPWDRLMRDLQEDNVPIDMTKIRLEPISTVVRWTDQLDERDILTRVRIVVDE